MPSLAGARCKLYINGNIEIGRGTQVSFQENAQHMRVDVLGDIYTQEIAPLGVAVQGSIAKVSFNDAPLTGLGFNINGDTTARLNQAAVTIQVFDAVSQVPIWQIEGVKLESRSFQVGARDLMVENLTFQATRLKDARNP
jgi:hypothetical protein